MTPSDIIALIVILGSFACILKVINDKDFNN